MLGASSTREETGGALRDDVRRIVLEAGFHRVGFARAGEAPSAEHFRSWADRGFAGNMAYMTRAIERRTNPTLVLAGARTVIVAAVHHREAGEAAAKTSPDAARIASYAQGTDYHRVVEGRLKQACAKLSARFAASYRWYVDTGPVLERDWAQVAGVGWIGKNTCSIDPERGSYFFLAVILTTLDLEPDAPSVNHCGSCRACIDACPTQAIVAPYELDARRCISYLTIEHRGVLPAELEKPIDDMIFGCDICQDVCPFNQRDRAGAAADAELLPRSENILPQLDELAQLDADSFRERFARSAVRRARHEGFLRNVIVALGNRSSSAARRTLDALAKRAEIQSNPTLSLTLERARRQLDP